VLATQHLLDLLIIELVKHAANIGAQSFRYVNGHFVIAMALGVEQACHQLVPAIEWCPGTV
jgi:hypothetical protein